MLSVYFNEMPSVFILPAYIKLLKQQKALKNQPFFKAFSRSFFTANSMGLVDKNATPNKNQLKVFWLFVMPTISQILCIRLIELEICNTL